MNFQSMEYFAVLAEERNFTKAAKRLYITQQSLSAHIASLEEELGCKLIVRQNPLALTYAGEVFLRYAQLYNGRLAEMKKEFSDISQNQKIKLSVGINYSRSMIFMPDILANLHREHPLWEVVVYENTDLLSKLQDGLLDIVITNTRNDLPGITYEEFFNEGTFLVLSKRLLQTLGLSAEQILASIQNENLNALQACPFIMNETEGITSAVAKKMFSNSDFKPVSFFQITNTNVILSMCLRDLGAGFVPKSMPEHLLHPDDLEKLCLFPLPDSMSYPIRFSYLKSNYQWNAISEFIRVSRETFTGI